MNVNDLQTFLKVVETGNFTKAADALGVPKSTISRRVSRLEDSLGVELLARKQRTFTVTPDGQHLHDRVAPALRDIADVERELAGAHEAVRGPLRITAPHDLGTSLPFAEMLSLFGRRFPEVTPHVELTMRSVDLLEEGFDVAFRARGRAQLPDLDGVMMRRISGLGARLYSNAEYLEEHGHPHSFEDLQRHRFIGFATRAGDVSMRHETTGERHRLPVESAALVNDFALLCALLQQGAGVGLVPDFVAGPIQRRGELVQILPEWVAVGGELAVLWPASRHLAPRVRSFIDFAVPFLSRLVAHTH